MLRILILIKEVIEVKRKNNTYHKEMDYMVCECNDGQSFKFDTEDYSKIEKYYWSFNKKNHVKTHINRKEVSLAKYILNLPKDERRKVLHRNGDCTDFRKQNLYYGNTYVEYSDYYIGKCFNEEEFIIDKEDYEQIRKYIWHVDSNGYVITKSNGKIYKQHRMILGLTTDDEEEVDHINHNQLDNRKSNLRLVNRSQQCMNTRIGKDNTSGVKGVYKMHGYDKWCAQINADGSRMYLGSYDSLEEAQAVRQEAAEKMHGEYKCD